MCPKRKTGEVQGQDGFCIHADATGPMRIRGIP
jgi:hypothetical protein